MALSTADLCALARGIEEGALHPDMGALDHCTEDERRLVWQLAGYERLLVLERRKRRGGGQRRAMRLLRSWLTLAQAQQLRAGAFRVRGSAGGWYRLWPGVGHAERVERHGRYWYTCGGYCLHEEGHVLPPADRTLAHLLLLRTDEPAFIAEANLTKRGVWGDQLWNGAYRRRLATRRLDPALQAELDAARARVQEGNRLMTALRETAA